MTVPADVFDDLLAALDLPAALAPALEKALAEPRFENRWLSTVDFVCEVLASADTPAHSLIGLTTPGDTTSWTIEVRAVGRAGAQSAGFRSSPCAAPRPSLG